jgi:hypothetical protein
VLVPAASHATMNTEYLRVKKLHQEAARCLSLHKTMELQPELSLGPVWPGFAAGDLAAKSSSSESDGTSRKKRKHYTASWEEPQQPPASLELQLNDPLPLDWEQCLDLQVSTFNFSRTAAISQFFIIPSASSSINYSNHLMFSCAYNVRI